MYLSFGREVQEVVSMAAIAVEPRKIGKENILYICDTTVGLSWRSLVCEGLSRHMAGAGAARVATTEGTVRTRVREVMKVIIIL